MSISIQTSDYIKLQEATIDGVKFVVRPMSSSETIAWTNIGVEVKKNKSEENAIKNLKKMESLFFALFDKPEEARKVLSGIGFEGLARIYQKIMEG